MDPLHMRLVSDRFLDGFIFNYREIIDDPVEYFYVFSHRRIQDGSATIGAIER